MLNVRNLDHYLYPQTYSCSRRWLWRGRVATKSCVFRLASTLHCCCGCMARVLSMKYSFMVTQWHGFNLAPCQRKSKQVLSRCRCWTNQAPVPALAPIQHVVRFGHSGTCVCVGSPGTQAYPQSKEGENSNVSVVWVWMVVGWLVDGLCI